MHNRSFRELLTIFILVLFVGPITGTEQRPVTIASYNIRNCININGEQNIDDVVEAINHISPDVIGLQEVDSATRRCKGLDMAKVLAERTGMYAYFSPAIDFDGGKYGVAVLCRQKPEKVVRIPLPGREEARTAIVLVWPKLAVCCTHLSLTEEDSVEGASLAAKTLQDVAGDGRTLVMLGDFNTLPESNIFNDLSSNFGLERISGFDQPTFPSDVPIETLDYILIKPVESLTGLQPITVSETTASDHRPIHTSFFMQ